MRDPRGIAGLLTRRDLCARSLLLGAGLPLGAATAAFQAVAAAKPEVPRRGGTLRLGLGGGGTTDSLDPLAADDSVMIAVNFALYNCLVEIGPDNRPLPELAESFEPEPGAKVWTLTLRRGVPFHNGKMFDADDAIYSLNLHRGPTSRSGAAGPMQVIADLRKLDPSRIEITLLAGDADFPVTLADYHVVMVPAGFSDWSHPIGSGAFRVGRFEPGRRITLAKAGDYWKPGRGHLDAVEISVLNDTAERMNALISGDVDAINRADPKTVSRIERSPRLDIVRAAGGFFVVMAMQVDRDPYTNLELRRALKYAVDRQAMIKTLFSGYGALGNDHPIPRSDPACATALPQLAFDPDRARFHFKRAGLASPAILLQSSEAAFNGAIDMASQFQASAGRCGIPVAVKAEPADGYWSKVWLKDGFVASYWAGRPAATQMLDIAYRSTAPWNETHWRVPAFDQVLREAKAETNEALRRQKLADLQTMLSADGGSLIPCFRDWLDARSDKVGGHAPHSAFDMDNGRIAEKAYLKP